MKIPKKIKVGGHWIDVVLCEDDAIPEDRDGDFSTATNTIRIKKSLPLNQQGACFLHEIFHVINGEMKEIEVEFLAQSLYQIIIDNDGFGT